jgi:hypothetical protein
MFACPRVRGRRCLQMASGWPTVSAIPQKTMRSTCRAWVRQIPTGMKAVGDPAIAVKDGRTVLAFTALPGEEAGWRTLVVIDITDAL